MEQKNLLKGHKLLGIAAIGAILILSVLISGCVEEKPKTKINETEEKTKIWVDYFNRSVEVPVHPKRIITLSKADTEILFTIGLGDRMVGRCYYCDSPHDALKLPDCGSSSKPNFEVILNQNPDLIILYTSKMGVNAGNYKDIIGRFEKYNLTVVVNPDYPYTIYEVIDYIKNDGKLVGEVEKAEAVVNEMNKKINFVKDKVKDLKENEKPRVGVISTISGEKIFASELTGTQVEIAGGINAFKGIKEKLGSTTEKSGTYISPEALIEINTDVIIISHMDYSKDINTGKTEDKIKQEQIEKIKKIPGWQELKAVKNNRICVIDGYKLYGTPRVADGLIEVAKCIHPELFGNESSKNLQKQIEKKTKIWVDGLNRTVEVPVHPKRIITLSKGNTEILFTMGLGNKIVGRSSDANYPPDVSKVPDCGSSIKSNFEVILNQSPDLIILHNSAGCCGRNINDTNGIVKQFEKYNLTVVVDSKFPYPIYKVMDYIKNMGKLVGEEERAERIVEEMKKKLNFVKEKVKNLKDNEKPRVAMVSPPYGETLTVKKISFPIEDAGGVNVFDEGIGKRISEASVTINPEVLLDKSPDVIIIPYTGYGKDILKSITKDEIEKDVIKKMEKIPGWNELKAVKNNRICVIDYYKIYGTPRAGDGLIEVAKCIHPELFGNENVPDETKKTKTFTDDLNRTVEIPKNPQRIVALSSGDVEILFAINASDKLVGRPNHQEYPPEALKIDDMGSLNSPNFEKILVKNPDLIIITTSFTYYGKYMKQIYEKYIKQIERLKSYNLTVLAFDYPDMVDEIINHTSVVGKLVRKENEANDLIENITFRMEKIANITSKLNESQKPTVYREWIHEGSKGRTAGRTSRDNELIVMAGGKNIFDDVEILSFEANFEEVITRNPKVIIITANLNKFKLDELKNAIKSRPGWENIDAVKNNRICIVEDQITWATPRIVQGLEEFAKCIHPELFGNEIPTPQNYSVNYPVVVTDGMNRNVTIYYEPKRIVSGHPAPTENLFALGVGDRIILRSDNCEYPPDALKIPSTTYPPSIESIVNSSPDVVFVYIGHTKIVNTLENLNMTVVAMPASKNYEDIIWTIKLIGKVVNKVEEAEKLAEELNIRIERIKNSKKEMNNPPKVLIFGGTQTVAIGNGTYIHEAATTAGGVNIFSDVIGKVDHLNMEVITARNPNIIILPHAFYDKKESVEDLVNKIKNDKLWQSVDAVKNNRFCIINRDILFSRTPRYVDTIEQEFNCFNNWETKKFCNSNVDCASNEFCNTTIFACKPE